MPGSWAAATDRWRGREPLAVVLARALAPWPLWLVLWGDPDRGAPFVTAALVASLMAWRASRGADRSIGIAPVALTVALAFGASVFLSAVASMLFARGPCGTGAASLPSVLLAWLSGAMLYELGRRCLSTPGIGPPARVARVLDAAAHAVFLLAPATGVVDLSGGGAPLPVVVGPLLALRVAGFHDVRVPPSRRGSLGARTAIGGLSVLVLVAAMVHEPGPGHWSAPVAWTVGGAAVSALVAAVVLALRARSVSRALSGVVDEHRPDGVVLAVAGGAERVHVLPSDPRPGAGMPAPAAPITFLDVEPVPSDDAPYRGGPPVVRARMAYRGTSEQLAAALLCRAWGWLAFSALSLAAAILLLY